MGGLFGLRNDARSRYFDGTDVVSSQYAIKYMYQPNASLGFGAHLVDVLTDSYRLNRYRTAINNYLAETMEFFLDDQVYGGKFPMFLSNKISTI